ncbi:uncharacterized protein LOC127096179 [Lathyrus oleraceus]|uniref:uncharacterized protein LOC127096179 n=1 Tax=Pisum sativum TaxID=3888 RepID=UPI0021CE765D|nr:uncharacterized protein LOC127096179 [Pisum sativum]
MKHMQHFTRGLKAQTRMLLDASAGTIKTKNEDELKELTERMCQNVYRSINDRTTKTKGVLGLDSNTTVLTQLEVISTQLAAIATIPANVNQIQTLHYDFCGHEPVNGNHISEGYTEKTYYARNF